MWEIAVIILLYVAIVSIRELILALYGQFYELNIYCLMWLCAKVRNCSE